jgi:hypothetical protein
MKKVFLSVLALLTYALCSAHTQQPAAVKEGIKGNAQNSADTWGLEDTKSPLAYETGNDSHFSFTEGDPNSSSPVGGFGIPELNLHASPAIVADLTPRNTCALQMLTTSYALPSAGFANGTFFIGLTGGGKATA